MNVAELLVRCLENEGVKHVFGIPGEETLALNAALEESEKIKFVLTRHEQGAAFMADVYGRLSSYPGVCLATLGPGATNLLTGIADAQLDRAPLVAITGQAGLERVHKELHQYIDVVRMFLPVTKWSTRIAVPEATPEVVRKAFRLARRSGIPATHTYMAKGVLDPFDGQSLPAVGLQRPGADLANIPRLAEADLVIAIGYDLVEWAPSLWNPKRDKIVVHIDSTAAELDGYYQPSVEVVGELDQSLSELAESVAARTDWSAPRTKGARGRSEEATAPLAPPDVIAALRAALGPEDIVVSDVGAHKVWLARLFAAPTANTVIISNGLAAMGIAVPGAIAAKLLYPERNVVAFAGDGGFLMNVQELETAKRLGAAIVCVVLIDGRLGVIEANERKLLGRTFATEFGNPGFVELARAFGIAGFAVPTARELFPTLRRALDLREPALVAVPWDYRVNARLYDKLD